MAGSAEVVARELRDRLERAREVVAERAEQAAGERRRAGRHVGGEAVEQHARLLQRAGGVAPREHGRGPRREVRPAALARLEQHAARARERVQRRRGLDAARRDDVREHAGARSQCRAHGFTVAPARAPAPPRPRRRAAPRAGPARARPSTWPSSSTHLAEAARRGGREDGLGIDQLGERDGPRLDRQPERARRLQQRRAADAGQQPVDRRRDERAAGAATRRWRSSPPPRAPRARRAARRRSPPPARGAAPARRGNGS